MIFYNHWLFISLLIKIKYLVILFITVNITDENIILNHVKITNIVKAYMFFKSFLYLKNDFAKFAKQIINQNSKLWINKCQEEHL